MTKKNTMTVKQMHKVIEEMTNGTVEFTRGSRFVYKDANGEFIGRRCRGCGKAIAKERLAKHRNRVFGYSSFCLACRTIERQNHRKVDGVLESEAARAKVYRSEFDGHLATLISSVKCSAKDGYELEIELPTEEQRNQLRKKLDAAMNGGVCAYTGKPLTRKNITAEHIVPKKRHTSTAYHQIGGWYDSIIFVDATENRRKNANSFLEYMFERNSDEIIAAIDRVAAQLDMPVEEVEAILYADDAEYRSNSK